MCYNNVMNRIVNFLQKYFAVISVLIGISILLSVTFSSYIVTSNNHKAAEMYIGELKYSIELNGSSTNTLTVPTGETIVDVKVNNLNPVDTYYKLLYLKNTNITVKYYESTKDTNDVVTTYNKPNDSITSSNSNIVKLLITNNSASSQNIAFTMKGGYITNTIQDIITPSTYSEITLVETPSTNTYFCTTTNTLTQGLKYVNGQYTYAYKQEGKNSSSLSWRNITTDGWGVQLTDRTSTDAVTSSLCTYINNKPISSMSNMFVYSQATSINLSNFNTSKVTNMSAMFYKSQATTLDLSSFDTSNVTLMDFMFAYSQATTLDASKLNTSIVKNMSYMFIDSQATTLDLSNFDTSNVTNMYSMFEGSQATTLDVSNFDTSKVTDMGWMFKGNKSTTVDVSKFDTSNVTNMSNMFSNSQATTLDVSNFNTSKVTNMSYMFWNSKSTMLDVSNFNTSNVTNMSYMFWNSKSTMLDVSNFNTSNVTNMSYMFSGSKATTLDLNNFDTSKVTNMSYMFSSSTNLKTIYVSNKFNTDKVTSSTYMFYGCTKLIGGAGTKYNSSYIDKTYAHIDGGTSNPGYFTDIAEKDIPAPNSFAADSWKTIIKAVGNNNISKYNVGDTRTIDMGTYGTHTLRIANKSKPSSCSKSGYSQTACGFVLEFADIITTYNMNPAGTYKNVEYEYGWNKDGWPASAMRTFVNNDIYNSLPSDLRSGIVETTVVSGYGSSDSANFTSTDKLYLLSPMEVWGDWTGMYGSEVDRAKNQTRQLDYYSNLGVTYNNYNSAIKKHGKTQYFWWHRSAKYDNNIGFYGMRGNGYAYRDGGVSPAFRIG
ncbi:putative uncharacterized protein [Clostridium sp. CAG:524]|nr:putative uncharacterized protein [Clostridium sp. CAG:524]